MAAYPARKNRGLQEDDHTPWSERTRPAEQRFPPTGTHPYSENVRPELRMYTEEEVAEMLHVSRSQLRKWRMGWNRGRSEGPAFKKMGRLIRYPESALRKFIYGP